MKKIVFVGGGSRSWTPGIARDMMLQPAMQEAQYVIHDPDSAASELLAKVLTMITKKIAPKSQVIIEPDVAKAFTHADAFLITISTGGLSAMEHDLKIPEKFGVFHTVGDTSGPGGWARALRNIPVFVALAEQFNRYAPNAVVLNYTNPMTVLTDVLARLCAGPVVGLCHGLFENMEFLAKLHNIPESEISVRYLGLNHFFWMLDARAHGVDLLADLEKRLKRKSLSSLMAKILKDPMGYSSDRDVAEELWRMTGVFPYLGDRHTCEYFPQYITDRRTMRQYRLRRTSIKDRWGFFHDRDKQLRSWIAAGLPDDQLKKSRETAADILNARFTGSPFIDVGNVPNIGQIDNLPRGLVVETPVLVDRNGFTPVTMGPIPPRVLPLVEPWVHVFMETAEAGLTKDLERALNTLRLDPVVAHLTTPQVKSLGQQLLSANAQYTKYLR